MKKETIIYGGAFNPPTLAHQAIVEKCIDYAHIHDGEIWLLPSGERKDKTIAVQIDQRLALLEAFIKDIDAGDVPIRIEESELRRQQPTETCETVREYHEHYPDRRFVWVFGTDSLLSMPSWRDGDRLLRTLPMLIAERDGSVVTSLGKNCHYLGVKTGGISSTEVRKRIIAGEEYGELVGRHVASLLAQR